MVGGGYFRVFRVSGAGSAQSVDWASPGRWCLRRWALARALAGVGGAATRVSTRTRSSFGCSPLYFRLQALRICDASQASPRVSERSPSGPVGPETNVSASVLLYKNPRVKAQPVRRRLQPLPALLRRGLASTAQQAWRLRCQVTQILPLGEQLCISVHWAVLQWPGSRERRVWTRFDDTVEAAHSDLKLASPVQPHPPGPCHRS